MNRSIARLSLALGLLAATFACSGQSATPPPQVTVSGTAEIKVAPDEVYLNVGVQTRHTELADALREHDGRMNQALGFLKQARIPDKDVQTDYVNVHPDYDYNSSWIAPRFYAVSKSIGIKLTTVTNLESVVTGLLSNGVNVVHGMELKTSQLRKYRDQARAQAVKAAREKAGAICTELGVKCGKPISINASDSGGWASPYYWSGRGNYYLNASANAVQNAVSSGDSPDSSNGTLALGQVSVIATVNVAFEIQ